MNNIERILFFILAPFLYICGYVYGYITEGIKIKSDFKRIKQITEDNFKPFWIETNQIFEPIETLADFKEVRKRFKKTHLGVEILDLKISKYDFDATLMAPIQKSCSCSFDPESERIHDFNCTLKFCSFGLRSAHFHDFDYTLRDWLSDVD